MHLRHLQVTDFRSWESAELELGPGATVLIGQNGRGKTNLLEAIGYLATLGSHRVSTDAPLIRHGRERALVRAAVVNGDRELTVELEIAAGRANRARLNRGAPTKPRDVLGVVHTVLFAPEDLALVKGDPAERRRFLDELLVQRAPRYAGVRADYERALKQRNALLKTTGKRRTGREDPYALSTLEVWDAQLAEAGAQLLAARLDLVADLAPRVERAYAGVAGGGAVHAAEVPGGAGGAEVPGADRAVGAEVPGADPGRRVAHIGYRASVGDRLPAGYGTPEGDRADVDAVRAALLAALAESRTADLERGVSLVGPHRDELDLTLGGSPAKGYASHGESWSFALALRLGSYELLRAEVGEPVLLLDDVFAELDRHRRARLAAVAGSAEQVLVTAAVAEDVPAELNAVRYRVADGRLSRE